MNRRLAVPQYMYVMSTFPRVDLFPSLFEYFIIEKDMLVCSITMERNERYGTASWFNEILQTGHVTLTGIL